MKLIEKKKKKSIRPTHPSDTSVRKKKPNFFALSQKLGIPSHKKTIPLISRAVKPKNYYILLNRPCPEDTYPSKARSLFRIRKNARRALSTPLSDTLSYPSFVCWANGARDDHLATCRMDPSKTSREFFFFQFFFHLQKVQTSLPQEMSPMCVVRLATWSGHPSSVGLLLAILFFSAVSQKSGDAWHFAAC